MHMGLAVLAFSAFLPLATAQAEDLNIYSARHYDTDLDLYENFTESTGININLIEGKSDELIARIVNEGENSPADLLITVDGGRLWRAVQKDIFQPVSTPELEERIPSHLRHPDGLWYGLSKRARVVIYNKQVGLPEGLDSYEGLANANLKGKVCIRSSSNIYNISLMAGLIEHLGETKAEAWAKGVVANFARPPQGNDRAQIRAVAAGECQVGVVNTYYVGRMLKSKNEKERAQAEKINILFPNQDTTGTHVNISGAGVLKHAPHKKAAIAFLNYLTNESAQRLLSESNNEYPIVPTFEARGPIATFGTFKEDEINTSVLGLNQAKAVMTYDRAGWK
ncbi:MAG: Fe(3+) ABC transporter substrate-binding protein [Parvibaculaceae bacterium]|nr:Fe(3+) ABC transporter substrate-binding protein [Parvibaculaceae bacterium]